MAKQGIDKIIWCDLGILVFEKMSALIVEHICVDYKVCLRM